MIINWRSWCWHLGLAIFLTINWMSVVTAKVVMSAPNDNENTADAVPEDNTISPESAPTISPRFGLQTGSQTDSVGRYNTLSLISLKCHSTAAGGTNPDKIFLNVGNRRAWSSIMNAGNQANITGIQSVFKSKVTVEIFDQSRRLVSVDIFPVPRGVAQRLFISGTAKYTLTYQTSATDGVTE